MLGLSRFTPVVLGTRALLVFILAIKYGLHLNDARRKDLKTII